LTEKSLDISYMKVLPWTKIGNIITLSQGYGKRLDKQKFFNHKGQKVDFFFIEQPSWATVLPITENGNVLLVRQYKQGANRIIEELPSGIANFKGETPQKIAKRELLEETGYRADKIKSLGHGFMNSRNSQTKFYCFLAVGCKRVKSSQLDLNEQIELIEKPFNKWANFVLKGKSDQWLSLILLRALPYLGLKINV